MRNQNWYGIWGLSLYKNDAVSILFCSSKKWSRTWYSLHRQRHFSKPHVRNAKFEPKNIQTLLQSFDTIVICYSRKKGFRHLFTFTKKLCHTQMFQLDWLFLHILHQSFEIERPTGHLPEAVVHLYILHYTNNNRCYKVDQCKTDDPYKNCDSYPFETFGKFGCACWDS